MKNAISKFDHIITDGKLEYLFHQNNALFIERGGIDGIGNVISLINFNEDELIFNLHDILGGGWSEKTKLILNSTPVKV